MLQLLGKYHINIRAKLFYPLDVRASIFQNVLVLIYILLLYLKGILTNQIAPFVWYIKGYPARQAGLISLRNMISDRSLVDLHFPRWHSGKLWEKKIIFFLIVFYYYLKITGSGIFLNFLVEIYIFFLKCLFFFKMLKFSQILKRKIIQKLAVSV